MSRFNIEKFPFGDPCKGIGTKGQAMSQDPLRQAIEQLITKWKADSTLLPEPGQHDWYAIRGSELLTELLAFTKAQRREVLLEEAAYWRDKNGLLTMAVVERCEQRAKELEGA